MIKSYQSVEIDVTVMQKGKIVNYLCRQKAVKMKNWLRIRYLGKDYEAILKDGEYFIEVMTGSYRGSIRADQQNINRYNDPAKN